MSRPEHQAAGCYFFFLFGTFLPFFRALDNPIAIACLRLLTLPPLPPGPLFAFPLLYSCISFFTSSPALREYFRLRFFAMGHPLLARHALSATLAAPWRRVFRSF